MADQLLNAIRQITKLPETESDKLIKIAQPSSIEKGGVFIREGDLPKKFACVTTGLFRYFYVNSKGSEFTKGFFPGNSFITSYTAMAKEKPSYYSDLPVKKCSLPLFEKNSHASTINITTGLIYAPSVVYPIYNATKSALHAFTQVSPSTVE